MMANEFQSKKWNICYNCCIIVEKKQSMSNLNFFWINLSKIWSHLLFFTQLNNLLKKLSKTFFWLFLDWLLYKTISPRTRRLEQGRHQREKNYEPLQFGPDISLFDSKIIWVRINKGPIPWFVNVFRHPVYPQSNGALNYNNTKSVKLGFLKIQTWSSY